MLWEVSFLGLTEIMASYHVLNLETKKEKKNVVKLEIKPVYVDDNHALTLFNHVLFSHYQWLKEFGSFIL